MIAACSWLAVAGFRENKRRKSEQQRIAAALSAALRSGLLDEVERSETPVWSIWGEEDDADSAPKSLVLSRYRVLGYSGELRERAVDSEDLPVRTIVRSDLSGIVTDQDLLLGIPRAVLKTERQPFPWAIATSSPSMEDTPDTGSDSKPYMIPDDLPCATEGLRVQ